MQSIVVVGQEGDLEKYIQEFITKNKIKAYNIIRIDKKIGIPDVRNIQAFVSIRPHDDEKKLIILAQDLTLEAQNALLKILEEPPSYMTIIILTPKRERLIPTLLSRCTVYDFSRSSQILLDVLLEEQLEKLIKTHDIYHTLRLAEFLGKEKGQVELFIVSLRTVMLKNILSQKKINRQETLHIYLLLVGISRLYPFIVSNNVNARFAVEQLLLSFFI